jgi:hypothetical protein
MWLPAPPVATRPMTDRFRRSMMVSSSLSSLTM